MTRTHQPPTRTPAAFPVDDAYRETHPAYAVIGASRVQSSPGATLFGSDFRHSNYIVIRIGHADLTRGLSEDWVRGTGQQIVEVALSEAQWATFLSTLNVGDGVPATLRWLDGEVPGITPTTDRRGQLNEEIAGTLADAIRELEEVRDAAPTKVLREKADHALTELRSNLPFVAQQFDRHAEKTIERAKVEVAAYVTGAIQRAGLAALAAGAAPVLELTSGEEIEVDAEEVPGE